MNSEVQPSAKYAIPVDAEHSSLRLVVVVAFVAVGFVTYLILNALMASEAINLIAILGGFLAAYGVTALLERWLKTAWPSGRVVEIDRTGVRIIKKGAVEQSVSVDEKATTLFWRFETKRRSRVPKGWYVLAVNLQQNEVHLPVYTFVSPEQLKNYARAEQFTLLKGSKGPASSGD
jgi:hypothetical protein